MSSAGAVLLGSDGKEMFMLEDCMIADGSIKES